MRVRTDADGKASVFLNDGTCVQYKGHPYMEHTCHYEWVNCEACLTSGKDQYGNRCLTCGGKGKNSRCAGCEKNFEVSLARFATEVEPAQPAGNK